MLTDFLAQADTNSNTQREHIAMRTLGLQALLAAVVILEVCEEHYGCDVL